jgi:hypothetical protein
MDRKLSDFKPPQRPVPDAGLPRAIDAARQVLLQAEAVRHDLHAKAAITQEHHRLLDETLNRVDNLRLAHEQRGVELTRAAETAAGVGQVAAGLKLDLADCASSLNLARAAWLAIHNDGEALRQDMHLKALDLTQASTAARDLLAEVEGFRAELAELRAPVHYPGGEEGEFPGVFPGSVTAMPALYPAGPTPHGFLYGELTSVDAAKLDLTGGSLTGAVDISITSGPSLAFSGTAMARSGAYGLSLNKAKTLTSNPHSLIFKVGGSPLWEWGVDFNTNNTINGGTGGSYIALFDHTANANAGADVWAISPAEQDSVSATVLASKFAFVGTGTGSAKDLTHLATFSTGTAVDLGVLSLTLKSGSARDHLTLVNAHATSKRNVINFGGFWKMGSDIAGAGTSEWVLRDATNSLNRLYVENTSAISAKMGLNTTGPVGGFHSATSSDASLYDVIQTAFAAGYSTINNRVWQVQQILDASQAQNFMWMFGTLGSSSTRATPTATSLTLAYGIKANQTSADLISAASGTNTAIVSALSWTNSAGAAQLGVLGATPISQQANTADLKDTLCGFGFQVNGGASPLNLDNGALTCGAIIASTGSFTGAIGGSGTSFQFNRVSFTFSSDADQTLDSTQRAAAILDVQSGVISTTRAIIIPGSAAGSTLWVINRNANSVTVKISGQTGITIAATRAALVCWPGGTTAFRLSPDVDYSA